ncbi:MAG: MazG-like family protein [Clostridia bacterium]|nr:MazG-like family protein [Clostridia bacterium]
MQQKVKDFNGEKRLSPQIRMLDIVSETGELTKEIIKGCNYGESEFKVSYDLKMELGDTLYAILSFCNENQINSQECLEMALEKYKQRLIKKGNMSSK